MQRINFLPWRQRSQQRENISFLWLLLIIVLVAQLLCVVYWWYLSERHEGLSNLSKHSQQFRRQRSQQQLNADGQLKRLTAFVPIYENIIYRQQQRKLLIKLLPFFKRKQIKSFRLSKNKAVVQLQATSWLAIAEIKESLFSSYVGSISYVKHANKEWLVEITLMFKVGDEENKH